MNINIYDDFYILCIIYLGFFLYIIKFAKMGKCLNFLFVLVFFFRFLKFFKVNNIGKIFCVLKNLRCKSDYKKREKIRLLRKL